MLEICAWFSVQIDHVRMAQLLAISLMIYVNIMLTGCEIRIFYNWPLGQYNFISHWPAKDFTGPNN